MPHTHPLNLVNAFPHPALFHAPQNLRHGRLANLQFGSNGRLGRPSQRHLDNPAFTVVYPDTRLEPAATAPVRPISYRPARLHRVLRGARPRD